MVSPSSKIRPLNLVLTLGIGLFFLTYALSPANYGFMDNVDLIFHEAGHPLFSIFGEFMGICGGTLMQVLIPTVAILAFIQQRKFHSATVVGYWLAQNFFNISVYARDARARQLPLLGGEGVEHDWSYILYHLGILHYDQGVGNFFYGIGLLIFLASLGLGIYFSIHPKEATDF